LNIALKSNEMNRAPSVAAQGGRKEMPMTEQLSLITTGLVFIFLAAIVIGLL